MKVTSDDELISLCAVPESEIEDAEERLSEVVGDTVDTHWLYNGVRRGFYKAVSLTVNGKAAYRYFYHVNDQGYLNINASVFVGEEKPNCWTWYLGANLIAKSEKVRGIVCTTARKGHIEQCRRVGFKVLGVQMMKEFDLNL